MSTDATSHGGDDAVLERLAIAWHGQALELCADRAVYAPDLGTLYVADTHFGKPEHFRAAGRPVPEDVTDCDLARLGALLDETGARRLVVLGDLFHAPVPVGGETVRAIRAWRDGRPGLEFTLVPGNHDRRAVPAIRALDLDVLDPPVADGPFSLRHEPPGDPGGADAPVLCGHVHPAVRLRTPGRRAGAGGGLRVACCWLGAWVCVLPAFGRFTGCRVIEPGPGDRVFALGEGTPIEVR
ncbi:MAG: ligase-associated DNA damage response endonuclease PdeM [Phycisphaerales bacterium JB040]